MISVTPEKARERFKTLPKNLQGAILAVSTAETIKRVAEQNGIAKEKTGVLGEVVGLVLLGYVSPSDVANELQGRMRLSPQTVKVLADSFYGRIFSPLRGEIEKAYTPQATPARQEVAGPPLVERPKIIDEIKKLERSGAELVEVLKRREEGGPVPSARPMPPEALIKVVVPTETPPPPVIIHEESVSKPIQPTANFRLEFPTGEPSFLKPMRGAMPPKPARVEVGGFSKITPPPIPSRSQVIGAPRVVDYSEVPRRTGPTLASPLTPPAPNTPPAPRPPIPPSLPSSIPRPAPPMPGPAPARTPWAPQAPAIPPRGTQTSKSPWPSGASGIPGDNPPVKTSPVTPAAPVKQVNLGLPEEEKGGSTWGLFKSWFKKTPKVAEVKDEAKTKPPGQSSFPVPQPPTPPSFNQKPPSATGPMATPAPRTVDIKEAPKPPQGGVASRLPTAKEEVIDLSSLKKVEKLKD